MQRETQTTKAQGIMPAATTHILTVDQVAARLQITKGAVYELTRFRQDAGTPRLPARKVGRSLRFIAAEIDQWVLSLPQHTHLQKRQYIKKDAPTAQPVVRRRARRAA